MNENPRNDQKEYLNSLKYSAEHLTSLINDILDYNKLESGSVEFEMLETNLESLINSIYGTYQAKASDKGIQLFLEYDEDIHSGVLADRTRLAQILNNLIDNALKFTLKGNVTVRLQKLQESKKTQTILFEIEDTGIGIPPDKVELIFERFTQASSSTTREFGGTGLGLSIIKRLLELQGSRINVTSEEGRGSKFYFEQSFEKIQLGKQNQSTYDDSQLEEKLRNKHVLLVEDNDMNVMVAEKFLKRWQMRIDHAKNGQEAVEMASKNDFDIVLMDLQMPVMDGYQASLEIRGMKNTVPILALTASTLLRVQEKVLLAGMNDYVTKPFDPKELKRKMAKYVR